MRNVITWYTSTTKIGIMSKIGKSAKKSMLSMYAVLGLKSPSHTGAIQIYAIMNIVLRRYDSVKINVIAYIAHLSLMTCLFKVLELFIYFDTSKVLTIRPIVILKKMNEFKL